MAAARCFASALLLCTGAWAADDSFTEAGAQFRTLYFNRDLPTRIQESWAAGGSLWARTGYWRDRLAFGATLYGSFPIYGPDGRDGTGSLKPGQKGYAVLGEAYAKVKISDQIATLYRQAIGTNPQRAEGVRSIQTDLNYLGSRDIRMTPLTYEAAMLNGPISDSLRYQVGYVSRVKDINAGGFVSMSRLAGVNSEDEGLWTGGLQWSPRKDLWIQGFYYSVKDTLRIGYADLDWVTRTSKDTYYRVAAQYSDQRSDGANLLTGHAFKTWNVGLYGEYGWKWFKIYGALGKTGEAQQIRTPYSFGPFYISQRIKTFSRAGEDAALIGTTFDLAAAGLPGFSIDFNIADGRNAIDSVTRAAQPKWREYDIDFIYRFAKESALSGMRLRFRWGTVKEDFGTRVDRTDDTRFDVTWAVSFQ
jgi:outer membrane OprD family porin